ncbi:hypothetical protein GQ53DRAFT_174729 [Thozetella sp. PMI_491]|nr:hypothetical protein GQ53DRAFT_174729 [Thozetella sp. PMI_491]
MLQETARVPTDVIGEPPCLPCARESCSRRFGYWRNGRRRPRTTTTTPVGRGFTPPLTLPGHGAVGARGRLHNRGCSAIRASRGSLAQIGDFLFRAGSCQLSQLFLLRICQRRPLPGQWRGWRVSSVHVAMQPPPLPDDLVLSVKTALPPMNQPAPTPPKGSKGCFDESFFYPPLSARVEKKSAGMLGRSIITSLKCLLSFRPAS